MPALMTRRERR